MSENEQTQLLLSFPGGTGNMSTKFKPQKWVNKILQSKKWVRVNRPMNLRMDACSFTNITVSYSKVSKHGSEEPEIEKHNMSAYN